MNFWSKKEYKKLARESIKLYFCIGKLVNK